MTPCPRIGKLFGGCKFRARFDLVGATDPFVEMISATTGQYRADPARSTYIRDVCERCGKTIERDSSARDAAVSNDPAVAG